MTYEYKGMEFETIENFKEYVKMNIHMFKRDLYIISYLSGYTEETEYIYGRHYFGPIEEVIDEMTTEDMLIYFDDLYDLED